MKMDHLVATACEEKTPGVSVGDRVMCSLQTAPPMGDDGPLCWLAMIGSGVALGMAAIAVVAWSSLLEPLMGDAVLTAWGQL
jgi:hypothetical protein